MRYQGNEKRPRCKGALLKTIVKDAATLPGQTHMSTLCVICNGDATGGTGYLIKSFRPLC